MKKTKCLVSLFSVVVVASASAYGLPIVVPNFEVDPSGADFTIRPIQPGEGDNIESSPTLTFGVTDPVTDTQNVMQMNWMPQNSAEPARAGWELVFGEDPDLTNQTIRLSIDPPGILENPDTPGGMTHVEVHIIDINGDSVGGWGFNTDQDVASPGWVPLQDDPTLSGKAPVFPGPPIPPPPVASLAQNHMQDVIIDIGTGPAAGSARIMGGPMGDLIGPNYLIAGTGGNLAQAAKIEFYENGLLAGGTSVPVAALPGLNNYWDHITVTPEPTSLVLLLLGGLALLARRRRLH